MAVVVVVVVFTNGSNSRHSVLGFRNVESYKCYFFIGLITINRNLSKLSKEVG